MSPPRVVRASNPGPFTLDGTRTYIVGARDVAVLDPGPAEPRHLEALHEAVADADRVRVLLTHDHPDHAAGASDFARPYGAPVEGPGPEADLRLSDGDRRTTDAGELIVVATPGHTREHAAFFWPDEGAVFVGDLVLGQGDTTWVGEYPGCVADYLDSLDRVAALSPRVLYSAHGPPVEDPEECLARFREHRELRIRQVEELLRDRPEADAAELLPLVYGDTIPPGLESAALASIDVILTHLSRQG